MPKVIKEVKNIEVLINIRYKQEEDKTIQTFQFSTSNKKYLDYLFDKRYLFKNKIEKLIKSLLLKDFISRIDSNEEVVLIYNKQEIPKNKMRKIVCQVPPYCGCQFCDKAEKKDCFVFCKEKNKHYTKDGIKRCPIFHMKEIVLT